VSNYSDINQLLEEIGASDRSADDPWTLSSNDRGAVHGTGSSPAMVGDLGAPIQDLSSESQSSERITYADTIASSPTGGSGTGSSSSAGGGFLGGLLDFFPLASGIAKLFGFGGSSSPPALEPYQMPPSINFEGAMSSPTSGVASLSYGENGLPRTSGTPQAAALVTSAAPNSNFMSLPAEPLSNTASVAPPATAGSTSSNLASQLSALTQNTFTATPPVTQSGTSDAAGPNMATQLGTLASSTFSATPSATNPILNSDLISNPNSQSSGDNTSSSASQNSNASGSNGSGTSSSSTQQGQSILVQVQAMDSQSFMDHSQDIAQAVRQAMLNLHSVNDVIMDL
jgi:hypothetical protein